MANEINQKLGFDASKAIKSLRSLAKALGTATTALNAFKASASSFNGVAQSFDNALNNMSEKAQKAAEGLKKAGNATQDASDKAKKSSGILSKMAKGLAGIAATAVRVFIIRSVSQMIRQFIQAIMQGIEAAREFGLAIAEIETISQGITSTTQRLTTEVMKLSEEFGRSAKSVAEGVYQTISNQIKGASDAFGVLNTAMKLAAVTAAQPKDAINAISSVLNSYNMSAQEATHVSDVLFKTVELGRLRLAEIADIIGRVTPLSAQLGISFEETAAGIAVMTRQGVKANTAVTQLRSVEQKLIKPTEALSAVFHKWGVEDGATAIKTFGGLNGVLIKLSEEVGGNSAEMADFFKRVRAIVGEMSLMTDEGKELHDTLIKISDAVGVVEKKWATFKATDAQQMTNAVEQLKNAYIRAGKALQKWYTLWVHVKAAMAGFAANFFGSFSPETNAYLDKLDELEAAGKRAKEKEVKLNPLPTEAELNKGLQAWRQALAEAQTAHNETMDKIKDKFDAFASGVSKRLKDAFKGLEGAIKPLEDFINNFKDDAASIASDIKKLSDQSKIEKASRKGGRDLAQAKYDIGTRSIEEGLLQIAKSIKAEDIEDGKRKIEYGKRQLEQIGQIAKKNRDARQVEFKAATQLERLTDREIAALRTAQGSRRNFYQAAVNAEKHIKDQMAEKNRLIQRLVKLYKDVDRAYDPKEKAKYQQEIKDTLDQISKIDLTGVDKAVLKALNIDFSSAALASGIKDAIERIKIDWDKLFAGASAALRKELDKAAAGLNLTSAVQQREQNGTLNLAKGIGQFSDVPDKAVSNKKRHNELVREGTLLKIDDKTVTDQLTESNKALYDATHMGAIGMPDNANPALTEATKTEKVLDSIRAKVAQGLALTQEDVNRLSVIRNNWQQENRRVYTDAKEIILNYTDELVKLFEIQQKLKANKLELNTDQMGNADSRYKTLKERSREIAEETKKAKENTKKIGDEAGKSANKVGRAKTAVNGVKTSTDQATAAMHQEKGAIVAATTAMKQLEAAARRAAAAASQAKSSATAYYGGVQTLAQGGVGQDTVPALLTPGEFVINKNSSKKFFSELNSINSGVQPVNREQGGNITNVGDVNVTVQGGETPSGTAREIGQALRRELRRGTLSL